MTDTASRPILAEAPWPAEGTTRPVRRVALVGIAAPAVATKVSADVAIARPIAPATAVSLSIGAAHGPRLVRLPRLRDARSPQVTPPRQSAWTWSIRSIDPHGSASSSGRSLSRTLPDREPRHPVITLYHCMSARSFRPLWMMEELGRTYELVMLPFPPRALGKSYLDINPLGTIPLLIDGETRITKSAAACQYLCERAAPTVLQVGPGEPDFGAYLNFLHFGEATLTFPQTLVLRYSRFEPEERRQPQVAQDYTRWFLGRLRTLESRLAERDFLCGDRFTAADVSVGYALLLAQHLGLVEHFSPSVKTYWERLRQRRGYLRAQKAQHDAAVAQGVSLSTRLT